MIISSAAGCQNSVSPAGEGRSCSFTHWIICHKVLRPSRRKLTQFVCARCACTITKDGFGYPQDLLGVKFRLFGYLGYMVKVAHKTLKIHAAWPRKNVWIDCFHVGHPRRVQRGRTQRLALAREEMARARTCPWKCGIPKLVTTRRMSFTPRLTAKIRATISPFELSVTDEQLSDTFFGRRWSGWRQSFFLLFFEFLLPPPLFRWV